MPPHAGNGSVQLRDDATHYVRFGSGSRSTKQPLSG